MSRRELFGSLCAMVFLVNLARVVFAPLVQPVAADFGVTAASLGVVTSAAWLGSAAPRLPTGYLLTRVDRHRVVAATGAMLVATSVFTGLSDSRLDLVVGAFLMGLSSGTYFIAANPLVSELFPDRLGQAIGVHGMASQLAAVGAPLAVSAILLVGEWRTTFLCIAAVAAVATVVLVVAARRTDLPDAGREDRSIRRATRAQWPIVLTGIALLGAAGFMWNAVFNLYGDYLDVAKGIDPATGRTLLSLMFAAGVPAFVVTGRLADRVPNVPLLLALVAATVVGVLALTVAEGLLVVAAVSVALGYAVHGLFPATDAYMLSSLPDRHRASAYSVYSASMMFVQALGSGAVGTAVAGGVGYTVAFRTVAAGVGVVFLGLVALYAAGWLPAGGDESRSPA
ncbi:MFS transporter [Natronomonas marina]|uniref:MFS transporter n=1 Tax=Natronomonas marina TaxID=2961939 RepID=UPI0033137B3D